jgi:hypothetical protein
MSLVVVEVIELQTNDSTRVVRLSQIEKYRDGSGYQCELTVFSAGFSCKRPFYFDDVALSVAVPELQKMATGTPGNVILKGQWEEDFLQLRSNAMGHVWVSGEIIEHSEFDQRLKFAFRTDQTILGPLERELRILHDA